ncbi:MAG TPA: tail fiber domain-containing protein [Chthonomonadaceae bacterium]|nr:tail fiber domain-containing protein [Chthonomonadaceae bacterium]
MNVSLGKLLSVGLGFVATVAELLLVPTASQAQIGNTATGTNALSNNTTGTYDTANGYAALFSNTTGGYNTANGADALYFNTKGSVNTANGYYALYSNINGNGNTATGVDALNSNTRGDNNTATGEDALSFNTTGSFNTATGINALFFNTSGVYNTATGSNALNANTTGNYNTAYGAFALYNNTTGSNNLADGSYALCNNTTGNYNTASGLFALYDSQTGNNNIGLGYGAGQNITTGSNNIAIGNVGLNSDNGVIRIGTPGTQQAAFLAGVNGVTASQGVAVYINANGQLGTLTSSRRFKHDIQNMGNVSDRLMDLRPVSFRYNAASEDGSHPVQYGLIAEEVAQVYPEMVQYDREGKPFTVYYQQLTPMMLNELQKAHHRSETQETEIGVLKSEVASLRQVQQQQLMVFAAFVLAIVLGAAFVLAARIRPSR